MSKRETISVFVDGIFVRHVTKKQTMQEVAGKVLRPPRPAKFVREGKEFEVRRICKRRCVRGETQLHCYYEEVELT